jgi:chromosome partitioning protein
MLNEVNKSIMKGIATINFKGGVGKTTITWLLARYASEKRGKKILLIDTDAQMSLTTAAMAQKPFDLLVRDWYKDKHKGSAYTIANLIKSYSTNENKMPLLDPRSLIYPLTPSLSLIPSTEEMYGLEYNLEYQRNKYFFRDLIKKIGRKKTYDYIFFDCSPNFSPISCSVLNYASLYLVPVNPDPFGRLALKTMTNVLSKKIDQIKKKKFGVFMNKVNYFRNKPDRQASDNWTSLKAFKDYPKDIAIEFWNANIPDRAVIPRSIMSPTLLEAKNADPKIQSSINKLWDQLSGGASTDD